MRDNIYHEIADKESGDFLFFPLSLSLSLFFVLYFSFTLSRSPLLSIFLSLFFSFSLFFFLFISRVVFRELHPHTGTRARRERPIARELRKAMRATRRALVPSYVLTRTRRRSWLVLSACPTLRGFPCPSTSWSLFRSFPLH